MTGWLDSLDGTVVELEERVSRFKRVLLSLAQLRFRMGWLGNEVRHASPEPLSEILDAVIRQSECGGADAREALMSIALWIAGHAEQEDLEPLRAVALERRYESLQRVIRRVVSEAPESPQQEPALPDYGRGRELALGERRSLARRADRADFDRLLRDPHPLVIRQLLVNPRTVEEDVLRLTAFRPARSETIREVARTEWLLRARVRMGILQNPGAPPAISVPLLSVCTRSERRELAKNGDLPSIVLLTLLDLERLSVARGGV